MDNEMAEIEVTANNPVQTLNRFSEAATTTDIVTYQFIETVRKVWLLGDIPVLDELFRSTRTESEQTELMIMITPTVLPLAQ